jgi:hypothetical protein
MLGLKEPEGDNSVFRQMFKKQYQVLTEVLGTTEEEAEGRVSKQSSRYHTLLMAQGLDICWEIAEDDNIFMTIYPNTNKVQNNNPNYRTQYLRVFTTGIVEHQYNTSAARVFTYRPSHTVVL